MRERTEKEKETYKKKIINRKETEKDFKWNEREAQSGMGKREREKREKERERGNKFRAVLVNQPL